jgi:hypothetical protein
MVCLVTGIVATIAGIIDPGTHPFEWQYVDEALFAIAVLIFIFV